MVRGEIMSKQDRQGVRTPADVERRHNLGQIKKDRASSANQSKKLNQLNQEFAQYRASINGDMQKINQFMIDMEQRFKELDVNIQTWFFSGIPTLENQPAVEWIDDDSKAKHVGDIYYNEDNSHIYLFKCKDGVYEWVSCTIEKEAVLLDYTVTFMVDGAVYEIVSVKSGNSVNAPLTPPTSENGSFVSWQLNDEDVVFPYKPMGDTELTALFQIT